MVVGIKANFESVDLAELCANKVRREVSGSKSIKIVSKQPCNQEIPATYSLSTRSENWVSTPLSILSVTRSNENPTTIPPRIIDHNIGSKGVRLEIICEEQSFKDVYRVVLSSGGLDIKKQYA
jgi:hypothetical protein